MSATTDKFIRAQPVAAAWNAGSVMVRRGEHPWHHAFLDELRDFTGVGDAHDDQVDALAGAFAALQQSRPALPSRAAYDMLPKRRM
jgi:predicted phage terminase large subunit-like protein